MEICNFSQKSEPKTKEQEKPWSLSISIFKDWRKDDEILLKKCFEFDWACSKIPQVVKKEEDIENIKQQLYKIYRFYKETYKYYAAQNPTGEVWSISQQPFTDFIYEIGIIDGKNLELADVFIKLKATLFSEDKNNPRNPEESLVRYQFMEVMVRIAEKRYKSSTISFAEAVEITIRDNLLPIYNKYTVAQKWREEKYWNEQCDDVLKAYKFILENVYSRYSVKKVKPSQKKFMCVEEFYDIFKHANLIDENFVERDVYLAFNQAMMTQVDELSSDRIFQMNFVEFLEAFSRCADKLSLPKIGWMPNNIKDVKNYEILKVQQLHYKIESAIVKVVVNCTSTSLKEAFEIPKISMFDKEKEDK